MKKKIETYVEMLKDPRWQKKRLEIMQRDNFTCQHCGAQDKNLQVHHLIYHKDYKPWEYKSDELITLCSKCHDIETQANQDLYEDFKWLKEMWKSLGFSSLMLEALLGGISSYIENILEDGEDGEMEKSWQKEAILDALFGTQNLNDFAIAKRFGYDSTYEINKHLSYLSEAWNKIKDKNYGKDF
jgi:hypothetical protein